MIPRELIRKLRRIEIVTNAIVHEYLAGQYLSVFKGKGMEFHEVREYLPGDDVRSIDWNVTARMGRPFLKVFSEERELTVILLVDMSSSGTFGTHVQTKRELMAEVSALLAFSAIANNDRVGLIIFTDKVEKFVPPRKGRRHVMRVIREILYFTPEGKGTNITTGLDFLNRAVTRRAVVFLISDFFDTGYEKILKIAREKHDLIAISVSDPMEHDLPPLGIVDLEDAETGELVSVDTLWEPYRRGYARAAYEREDDLKKLLSRAEVDHVPLTTGEPYLPPLRGLFEMRARRLSHG